MNLTEYLDQFVEESVRSGRFSNASEVVREGLRLLEQRQLENNAKLEWLLADGVKTYHLRFSRNRVKGERVKRPRHFLLYRVTGNLVEVARVLHDSRDLERHIPDAFQST